MKNFQRIRTNKQIKTFLYSSEIHLFSITITPYNLKMKGYIRSCRVRVLNQKGSNQARSQRFNRGTEGLIPSLGRGWSFATSLFFYAHGNNKY